MSRSRAAFLAVAFVSLTSITVADQWPQWMGPRRDNIWREEGIINEFPEAGPKVLWRAPVAGGYAGPAVVDGRVFVMDYVTADDVKIANFERKPTSGTERILCLDEATGKEKWKVEYPVAYDISYPAGPRCTPTVDGDKVYCLGAVGDFHCLDAATGKILWHKNFPKDYHTKTALWGYASHPLIDGDNVICVVGGEGTHAVAFDKNTGEQNWAALTSPEQGYSPPTIIEAGGVRQLLLLAPNAVTSVDPATGKEYWSVPYTATNGSIIMSPVIDGDLLYVGGYSNQSLLLKVAQDKPAAEVVWANKGQQAISPINVQPYAEGGILYGFDQKGTLRAIELAEGKRLWETSEPVSERPANSGTAFIVRHGDVRWMFNDSGDLVIGKITPAGFEELDRAHVIEPTNDAFGRRVVWCAPAFANKRAYIRNDEECICVDLAAE
ncbi:MAG: PQQ-like beta-propeller repeat protein [Planctomycetaceae bacterium]|uniref:Outer membrane biogenesis protein BamB n=1 Tax=Lacipirellula limnantheis TaxID=2528024 RepID=A0A517U0N6_9BACT|nr:PQQ-binding-like beta-propeller repeat protein [Lacipirellula limnantheis]MBL9162520.1 PQQ-like beta-propeller repeat protein [Planctomycetaceae bacterium]QDT74197.1 outer membrane biogenesis protein BamB [Lacipirellula limnantheis]